MNPGIVLRHLVFTGPTAPPVRLDFSDALNLLYGASNTGKSFALKALDFALGGSKGLPEISERDGYDRVWLALTAGGEAITLARALAGGNFQLWPGHVGQAVADTAPRSLGAKHDAGSDENVSRFLLGAIGLTDRLIAVDVNGKKRSLSFRDVARFSLVDETAIQSEDSPLQSGQTMFATAERSVFKLLLTGVDDSAIVEVIDRKTFKTSTAAKIEMLDDLLQAVQTELDNSFPEADGLAEQEQKLEKTFAAAQADVDAAQTSIRASLDERAKQGDAMERAKARLAEVEHNLARFGQLDEIYRSDVERLEALASAWPERDGVSDRITRLRTAADVDERLDRVLANAAAAERRRRPDEALRLLQAVEPSPPYAARFREAIERAQADWKRLDQAAPAISLRQGSPAEFEKGATTRIALDVSDDFQVAKVALFARVEGGAWQQLELRSGGGFYSAEISPAFHQNKDIQWYATASDLSGHSAELGNAQSPRALRRKKWFDRLRGKEGGGG